MTELEFSSANVEKIGEPTIEKINNICGIYQKYKVTYTEEYGYDDSKSIYVLIEKIEIS